MDMLVSKIKTALTGTFTKWAARQLQLCTHAAGAFCCPAPRMRTRSLRSRSGASEPTSLAVTAQMCAPGTLRCSHHHQLVSMSNPSMFRLNEVVVGALSEDVLKALSSSLLAQCVSLAL